MKFDMYDKVNRMKIILITEADDSAFPCRKNVLS